MKRAPQSQPSQILRPENMEAVIPFKSPANFCLFGPSQSGKSHWILNLLRYRDSMFEIRPHKVVYCFNQWQPIFEKLEEEIDGIIMHQGVASLQFLQEHADGRHFLVIYDDLQSKCNSKDSGVSELFCVGSHALQMSIILVGHTIFGRDQSVVINRNTHYILLMRDNRDKKQIACLAGQVFPGQTHFFKTAYELATSSRNFGYLLVSVHPQTPKEYALSTCIFPNEPTIIYKPV